MVRKYFEISEQAARTAHNMMSMSDYVEGSKTAAYRSLVDSVYEIADKIAEVKPKEADRAYALAERFSRKMAENFNQASRIGCMCPSVLISGAGNFPVKKKEKQNAASDKNMQEYNYIMGIKDKLWSILHGKEIIKSGDEDAIERLEEKLEGLKELQETMKAVNKAIRIKDETKGNEELKMMGYSDAEIKELRTPDFCGRVGFPQYALQNNNANIHRVEDRIKQLKAAKERGTQEEENEFFKVVENTEIMRLQLFFDGKPEEEVRNILKSHGFRWSPKEGAWQRQLTANAKYSLKSVLKELKEKKTEEE